MSRAHMLYDDKPLDQTAVETSHWPEPWKPVSSGAGVLLEGTFHKKGKHVILDSKRVKHRFVVFHVEFARAHRRKFTASGEEIEPNFGLMGKISKGYLPSSYKAEAKGEHDIMSCQDVKRSIGGKLADLVPPLHADWLVVWGEEKDHDHMEVEFGDLIRVKTRGDSPLIETISVLENAQRKTTSNYAGGDKVGQSWTDKVMGFKTSSSLDDKQKQPLPHEQVEGVDDDEWDD